MKFASLLTTALIGGAALAQPGVNLVQNPSFEIEGNPFLNEVFANWEGFGNVFPDPEPGGTAEVTAFDGSVSCKMFGGFFGPGVQSDTGVFQIVPTPGAAGKTFRASVTVQSSSLDPLAPLDFGDPDGNGSFGHLPLLLMQFRDATGAQISQPEVTVFDAAVDPNDEWITRSVQAIAPAGTEEINVFCLFIQFGDDPGSLYWDSVELIEVEDGGPDCSGGEDNPVKVVADSTAPWTGFMNVFELDGTTYAFGSNWAIEDLTATFDDGVPSVSMSPAEIDDPSDFWYQGGNGGPGVPGNKLMEANLFQETQGCLAGQTVEFSGFVQENSLAAGYESTIFIRDFASDFSSFNEARIPATPGPFTVTLNTVDDISRVVQWGFTTTGPNVWPGDAAALGSVTFSSVPGAQGCNAADIAEPYGILDLADINAFVSGFLANDAISDLDNNGIWDLNDITDFVDAFVSGCP